MFSVLQEYGGQHRERESQADELLKRLGSVLAPSGAEGVLQWAFIPPNGWCFYNHVFQQVELPPSVRPGYMVLAGVMITYLAVGKASFEELVGGMQREGLARRRALQLVLM